MMKKIFKFNLTFLLFLCHILSYECTTLKLDNISSERALTTLSALGYNIVEHSNIYMDDIKLNNLSPLNETITDQGIFIIDIPDYENYSLDNNGFDDDNDNDNDEFTKYLSGSSMNNPTQSDPIERIMVCYERTYIEEYSQLLNLLYNELDIPAKQILIEALIVEINSDVVKDNGLSIEYLNQQEGININTPISNGLPFSFIFSENGFVENLTDEYGYPISNDLEDIFKLKLNALINDKSAEILSKPSILVLDGRQARIQVGQQIPISKLPISTFSGDEILIPDIEYIPVGIVLNIKPRISNDLKSVSMQVETIITETEELISGVLEAPIINNRKVESHVKVLNNTPFIIGGLISNKKADQEGKVPILNKIPFIGNLFSWKNKQTIKKEVIVVITPHIIDNFNNNFSRVIPQDESIFDSFGNILFPNSYRLKESDIYNLNFITESEYLNRIKKVSKKIYDTSDNKNLVEISNLILNNKIPGEQIITRRMIYDIIEKQHYYKAINNDKIIFFNSDTNFNVDFIKNYLNIIKDSKKGIILSMDKLDIKNNNFLIRPGLKVEIFDLKDDFNYKNFLKQKRTENNFSYPIVITEEKHLKRLYEVLIMQEVIKLNSSLEMSINEFKRGLEIQFPAKELLSNNSFVIDNNVAKYFYDINFYYDSFENEFYETTEKLLEVE